jgi:hypothetical protein
MPNRWLAIGISAFWVVMMAVLLERDVFPRWRIIQRPNFRAVVQAQVQPEPVRWAVLQGEDRIGTATTEWVKQDDGWTEFRGELELKDLSITPALASLTGPGCLRWQSSFHIAPDGNLHHFNIQVFWGESKPAMTVHGKLDGDLMKVLFRSGGFTHEEQFYYEPHSLMMTSLAPIDKLPNLSVGQSWEQHVTNPIPMLGSSETVRCHVTGEQVITWRGEPAPTFVVEESYGPMRARCWVAHDGTVLRQEVPIGWSPLVLEHE